MRVAAPADKRFRRAHVRPPRRRHSWARALRIVRSAAALALFAAGAYLLQLQVVQARALHVDRIAVRGNQRLSTGEVLVLLEGLRGQHLLAVDLDRWRRRVMSSPWVEHASLRRVLPSTVEVTLSERQPMAIGRLAADLYLIDADGHVIDEYGPEYAQFDLPIIDGLSASPDRDGAAVDEGRADLANRLLASVGRRPTVLRRLSQIDVSNVRDAVVLLENDTTLVHLGEDQFLERLQSYVDLSSALHDRFTDLEYADVRFDNHIYVRPAPAAHKAAARVARRRSDSGDAHAPR
jgi:cell division septal protein FtsQ